MDNWFDIPDPTGFHYGWTKVEGIILNIIPKNDAVHETFSQLALEIYPNPVSDVLYIKNLPCEQAEYSIFNVMGQKVNAGSSDGTISVADLEKGLYILQINAGEFRQTEKFIVK